MRYNNQKRLKGREYDVPSCDVVSIANENAIMAISSLVIENEGFGSETNDNGNWF